MDFVLHKTRFLFISSSSPKKINHILDAFKQRNDLEMEVLDQHLVDVKTPFIVKVFIKLKIPLDSDSLNKRILDKVKIFKPDIVFIVKGNTIYPWTLKKIRKTYPNIKLISWSQDDMYANHNRSLYYSKGIRYYNLVVTQKSYNIKELKRIGAKKVLFQNKSFSKKYHNICEKCQQVKYRAEVLFIGFAEKERFDDLNYLAKNGIKIDVYGSGGWNKKEFKKHNKNLNINQFPLYGDDYANAISCSKLSLCFLRKVNRDLQTSRSVEIPACGGVMVAERTDEHMSLFEEGKEAVYFDSKEELLQKIEYYLKNEIKRKKIANAGYARTRKDDYSYDNRIDEILKAINEN